MPKLRTIEHNLLVNDHNAMWPLDHDDGSDFYIDRHNVLIHGGSKNLNGYSKQIYGNLFIRPDIGAGRRHCHQNYGSVCRSAGSILLTHGASDSWKV